MAAFKVRHYVFAYTCTPTCMHIIIPYVYDCIYIYMPMNCVVNHNIFVYLYLILTLYLKIYSTVD